MWLLLSHHAFRVDADLRCVCTIRVAVYALSVSLCMHYLCRCVCTIRVVQVMLKQLLVRQCEKAIRWWETSRPDLPYTMTRVVVLL